MASFPVKDFTEGAWKSNKIIKIIMRQGRADSVKSRKYNRMEVGLRSKSRGTRLFVPWTIRTMDFSFYPWICRTIRITDSSYHPRTFRTVVVILLVSIFLARDSI